MAVLAVLTGIVGAGAGTGPSVRCDALCLWSLEFGVLVTLLELRISTAMDQSVFKSAI
jgi:hypothetical protein